MKKKRLGNIVMVLLIAVIAVTGVLTALHLRGGEDSNLGSLYKITAIPDNSLITPGQEGNVCTVTIVCDTVLDNLGSLDEEKAPYVPKDAVILPKTQVSFTEGDTVFDVLQKVCTAADGRSRGATRRRTSRPWRCRRWPSTATGRMWRTRWSGD